MLPSLFQRAFYFAAADVANLTSTDPSLSAVPRSLGLAPDILEAAKREWDASRDETSFSNFHDEARNHLTAYGSNPSPPGAVSTPITCSLRKYLTYCSPCTAGLLDARPARREIRTGGKNCRRVLLCGYCAADRRI